VNDYIDLAVRDAGAIRVALLWHRVEHSLVVIAHDDATGESVRIPVSAEHAADVYRHPFAYSSRSVSERTDATVSR
jgi:hypothetical protein